MTDPAVKVVEFVLTTHVYDNNRDLDPDDLPARYREVFYAEGEIERPLTAMEANTKTATGVERPWDAVSDLLFTERKEYGKLAISEVDMALDWFAEHADAERIASNPTLAAALEGRDDVDVSYEAARETNRPIQADRVWIDNLLAEYFGDEEDEEMLDLVQIKAPEEIEFTLDDLVLTPDQEREIQKIVTAIENRDYLASIGLREIGKLLFVGPPGTGKTTAARAIAQDLELPCVEVKLSMIASQYLGETSKNLEKAFEVAKRLSPCILFIDEFDSVAKTRRSDEHAALKRAVNTLLKSIDDISLINDEVLLIGATNHPDQLDAAAWRRFDEIVNFPKPDEQMRADIFRVVTEKMDIADFDPVELAEKTEGLTGSDLRMVLREAILEALTDGRRTLQQRDIMDAVEGFEERDNLKNMDMIEGDADELIAGDGGQPADDGDGGHDHSHDH
jgi:ATP-dependent 26S proteasome regulatory subunit